MGQVVRRKRGDRPLSSVSEECGVQIGTLSRVERGTHQPSFDTAVALARWLGWSVEQVYEAARTPVDSPDA